MTAGYPDYVKCQITGVNGNETRMLRVGVDLTNDQFRSLYDIGSNSIYSISFYQGGKLVTQLVPKSAWDQAKDFNADSERNYKGSDFGDIFGVKPEAQPRQSSGCLGVTCLFFVGPYIFYAIAKIV